MNAKLNPALMDEGVGAPGDCCPFNDMLIFACPGCGQVGGIRVGKEKPARAPSWEIAAGSTADPSTLTLQPSINCVGCCGWHGFLKAGRFEKC